MLPALLTAALLAAPAPTDTRAARLAAYILKRQRRSRPYAHLLAARIVAESKRRRIDTAAFAAIGWNESWWWWKTSGTSHEYGVWQLWPAGSATAAAWDRLRAERFLPVVVEGPDRPWRKLSYTQRRNALHNIHISTAMAALVVRRFVQWCRHRHRVKRWWPLGSRGHRQWTDRYAHFNSGLKWPRMGYHYRLRRRTRIIRRVLNGR
jgi:hypothetical protein